MGIFTGLDQQHIQAAVSFFSGKLIVGEHEVNTFVVVHNTGFGFKRFAHELTAHGGCERYRQHFMNLPIL